MGKISCPPSSSAVGISTLASISSPVKGISRGLLGGLWVVMVALVCVAFTFHKDLTHTQQVLISMRAESSTRIGQAERAIQEAAAQYKAKLSSMEQQLAKAEQRHSDHAEQIKGHEDWHKEHTAKLTEHTEQLAQVKEAVKQQAAVLSEAAEPVEVVPPKPKNDGQASKKAPMRTGGFFRPGRGGDERRLGAVMASIKAHNSFSSGAGCVTVDLSSADVTINLGSANYGTSSDIACPLCFIITGPPSNSERLLKLSSCSNAFVQKNKQLSAFAGTGETALAEIIIINSDTSNPTTIWDGTNYYTLGPLQTQAAYCYSGGGDKLMWGNSYFRAGLKTGTNGGTTDDVEVGVTAGTIVVDGASTLTGAITASSTLTVAGAVTISGTNTLTVGGATTLNGDTALGNELTDAITIKGAVAADGTTNPTFDFSTSSGTFKTSTGISYITGALDVTGASTFDGSVTLGDDATADVIMIKGNVQTTGNPAFTIGSAAFTLTNTGALTLGVSTQATTILGSTVNLGSTGATDTVNIYSDRMNIGGNVAGWSAPAPGASGTFDISDFSSTTVNQFTANDVMQLGTARTDTITIWGNIQIGGAGTAHTADFEDDTTLTVGTISAGSCGGSVQCSR